jgi:hypothetical protein
MPHTTDSRVAAYLEYKESIKRIDEARKSGSEPEVEAAIKSKREAWKRYSAIPDRAL